MPVDVMPSQFESSEEDARNAARTITVQEYYYFFPPERKKAAREALRHSASFKHIKEDGMADVALEQLWNILAGNH